MKGKNILIPAILKKEEILKEYQKKQYTEDLMYENGGCDNYMPDIIEEPDKETYQFAIVNSGERLVGYIAFTIDWYSSIAHRFGVISFDKGNPLIGEALYEILEKLIKNLHLHKIEWRMVKGNPIEKNYDKFLKKHDGRKVTLHDVFKDRRGNYHDTVIYEIISSGKNGGERE